MNLSDQKFNDIDLDTLIQYMMSSNATHNPIIPQRLNCRETPSYKFFLGYAFFPLLAVCIIGNCINVIVYAQKSLRKSVAIQMLTLKAIFNTLFMVTLVTNALHIIFTNNNIDMEILYFRTWPYLLMLSNTCGSYAMWLTVLMMLERYLIVVHPLVSKQWCCSSYFMGASGVILVCCLAISLVYPISRHTKVEMQGGKFVQFEFTLREGQGYVTYESVSHLLNLSLCIIIPLLLLTTMSLRLSFTLLTAKNTKNHHMSEKRCVTRISLVTTVAQLILETPASLPLIIAAIRGPNASTTHTMCTINAVANFSGMCSASTLFFIYVLCSGKFRRLVHKGVAREPGFRDNPSNSLTNLGPPSRCNSGLSEASPMLKHRIEKQNRRLLTTNL